MPNGDYSLTARDWERIRAFFHRHTDALKHFAECHNLVIDEYYHDSPSWSFRFRHPKGGGAAIHVERVDDLTIKVGTSWYLDDFENFTRFAKADAGVALALSAIDLGELLETTFRRLLSYEKADLTGHGGYKEFWSPYTKEELLEMSVGRLPYPKV